MSPADRIEVSKTWKLYVGGAFVRSESGRSLRIEDASGEFVANVARASRKDLRDAVVAARKAQPGWSSRSAFNRGQILYRAAEMLEGRRAAFEDLLGRVTGRRKRDVAKEVDASIDRVFWYAGWTDKLSQILGGVNPVASPYFDFSLPEPMGVVAVLAPRSAPLLGLVSSVAPVVASGNTCVAVVDGEGRVPALELGEVLATSDLPGGVVNLLTGHRDELAPHAASHQDVDALVIHGGTDEEAGPLQRAAADSVQRCFRQEDPAVKAWLDGHGRSPYRIADLVEWKTTWHPIGV